MLMHSHKLFDRDLSDIKLYLEEVIHWWCFISLLATRVCVFVSSSNGGTVKGSDRLERKYSGHMRSLGQPYSPGRDRSAFFWDTDA